MLTPEEAKGLRAAVGNIPDKFTSNLLTRDELLAAIERATDNYAPNQGTDCIAKGPNISTTRMLDEAARALGWRTDWTTGSPITWELVLEEIRTLRQLKVASTSAPVSKIDIHLHCPACGYNELKLLRTFGLFRDYRCGKCEQAITVS